MELNQISSREQFMPIPHRSIHYDSYCFTRCITLTIKGSEHDANDQRRRGAQRHEWGGDM